MSHSTIYSGIQKIKCNIVQCIYALVRWILIMYRNLPFTQVALIAASCCVGRIWSVVVVVACCLCIPY